MCCSSPYIRSISSLCIEKSPVPRLAFLIFYQSSGIPWLFPTPVSYLSLYKNIIAVNDSPGHSPLTASWARCGTLITVMGDTHVLRAENGRLSVNFSTEVSATTFQNLQLVYFLLFSSWFDVSHQSSRRQLISFLWHTMMDLCCNPDLFWELQFLKLKACMSHGWKSYWSDVDGQLKRNGYIPCSSFFFSCFPGHYIRSSFSGNLLSSTNFDSGLWNILHFFHCKLCPHVVLLHFISDELSINLGVGYSCSFSQLAGKSRHWGLVIFPICAPSDFRRKDVQYSSQIQDANRAVKIKNLSYYLKYANNLIQVLNNVIFKNLIYKSPRGNNEFCMPFCDRRRWLHPVWSDRDLNYPGWTFISPIKKCMSLEVENSMTAGSLLPQDFPKRM